MLERKFRNLLCAVRALERAWREEPSFRIQLVTIACVSALAFYFRVSSLEWMLLLMVGTGVISIELVNTAIERIGNMISQDPHPEIRFIKDLGTAAVIAVLCAALVVTIIFVPRVMQLL